MEYGNATAAGMASDAPQAGSITAEATFVSQRSSDITSLLARIEGKMQFPPRPEGLNKASGPGSKSGIAATLRDSGDSLAASCERLGRVLEAL